MIERPLLGESLNGHQQLLDLCEELQDADLLLISLKKIYDMTEEDKFSYDVARLSLSQVIHCALSMLDRQTERVG